MCYLYIIILDFVDLFIWYQFENLFLCFFFGGNSLWWYRLVFEGKEVFFLVFGDGLVYLVFKQFKDYY